MESPIVPEQSSLSRKVVEPLENVENLTSSRQNSPQKPKSVGESSPQQKKQSETPSNATVRKESKVFFQDYGESDGNPTDIGHRLHKASCLKSNKNKEESDAIVSDLSGETLRWLKKRRDFDAEKKIVISSFREKQLREMFQSLDFEGTGALDLDELTEAVTYVQQKTKNSKGLEQFQNIQETFIAMDDNGDGTVDFSEFIKAMTGTTQSTFDKASEYDVERLFSYFIEYGELKQREMAWRKITEAQHLDSPTQKKEDEPKVATDTISVKHFKALFGATEESEKKYSSRISSKTKAKELSAKKSAHMEQILQDFIAENSKSPTKSFSLAKFSPSPANSVTGSVVPSEEGVHSKYSEEEYLELQNRLREERKEAIERQNLVMAEAGLLEKKKSVRSSMRFSRSNLPTLVEENGTISMRGSISSGALMESTRSIHLHNTLVPTPNDTKQDLLLKSTAKKEAYDILRRPRTSQDITKEDSEFRVKASTFDTPYSVSQMSTPKGSRRTSFATPSDSNVNELVSPTLTTRKSIDASRKSKDFTRKSVEFSVPDGTFRLPSIRTSISIATNGPSLSTPGTSTSSKKNHMIRASFAF